MNFMQRHRLYVKPCYDKSEISHHTSQLTNAKINSIKISSITEMNDSCNVAMKVKINASRGCRMQIIR